MTTRTNTRSSQLRENNTNEEINYQFEEQDSLHIPEAIVNRFKDEGMTLGWLRITLRGQDDFKYIGKKMSRNEPCFCGSGKKYKRCCGAL